MNSKTLGRIIAAARKAKRLTQQQAADKLGVTMMTWSRWECGYHCPDVATLDRICRVLGRELMIGIK